MLRQGDVLLARVRQVPKSARPVRGGRDRVVLARGESTGHAHAIVGGGVQRYVRGDNAYLRVLRDGARLTHEEHDAIQLPRGCYRIVQQREYTPEGILSVAD